MLTGKNISCSRGGNSIFSNLSFFVEKGEQLTIKGANGSGKSTLLRLLAGFMPPKTGTLSWKGEIVSKHTLSAYQQNLLYVGHKICLHPEARVRDQIQLWHNFYKIPMEDLQRSLENWGIGTHNHKKISHLSQGQQKRLSLSRCNWLKRSLWILDEPEASLDREGQIRLADVLSCHLEMGGIVVQATHQNPIVSSRALLEGVAIQKAIKKLNCDAPPPSWGFLVAPTPAKAGDDRGIEVYSHSIREILL